MLGVNHLLPLLHMSKRFVFINATEELINQFAIGYMTNHKLHVYKVFRDQAETFFKRYTSSKYHERYKKCSEKKGYMHYCISNVL